MLDSIYQMKLKILKNHVFWYEKVKIFPYFMQRYNGCH